MKNNVLYSIPCVLAFLLVVIMSLMSSNSCFAAPSASLTIGSAGGTSESLSTTAVQGSTAYLSSTITATTTDTESYALTINGPIGLSGGSNISGASGNKPISMPNNSWGYAYNDSSNSNENKTYKSFTGSNQELEKGTVASGVAKNITFAAKFAGDATPGHYTATVNVNLVATPKVTTAKWSNGVDSGIEYMQDIQPGFCTGNSNIPINTTIDLKDKRDEATYKIIKWDDGRCWMYTNLTLHTDDADGMTLDSNTSDIKSSTFTLPQSKKDGFSSDTAVNAYYDTTSSAGATGYYTWCVATAGSAGGCVDTNGNKLDPTTAVSSGNVDNSICPKNWKLPIGSSSVTAGSFSYLIATKWGVSNDSDGSTTLRNKGFVYTGYMGDNQFYNPTSIGNWWSRTAYSDTEAYRLYIYGNNLVLPGTNKDNRYLGSAVRCVAEDAKTYTLNYDMNTSSISSTASVSVEDSYKTTFANEAPMQTSTTGKFTTPASISGIQAYIINTSDCGYGFSGWATTPSGSVVYSSGAEVTATSLNTTLYAKWSRGACKPI